MYKILSGLVIFVSLGISAIAQDHNRDHNTSNNNQPPAAVQKSFQNEHPDQKDVHWQRNNQQWHSSHTDAATRMHEDTYYDQRGNRIDNHREVGHDAVPQPINTYMHDRYHADSYTTVRIERPHHSPVFSMEISQRNGHRKIYTDKRGHEIRYNDHH